MQHEGRHERILSVWRIKDNTGHCITPCPATRRCAQAHFFFIPSHSISHLGRAFWSSATPAALAVVRRRSSHSRFGRPARCLMPASVRPLPASDSRLTCFSSAGGAPGDHHLKFHNSLRLDRVNHRSLSALATRLSRTQTPAPWSQRCPSRSTCLEKHWPTLATSLAMRLFSLAGCNEPYPLFATAKESDPR